MRREGRAISAAPSVTRMPRERRAEARIVGVDQLLFHPRNVRTDLGDLRELADSIAIEGVLVPVMAERRGQTLRLLHGTAASPPRASPASARAMRKVVSAGHEVFSGCWGRPRMESMRCGSLWILRMVAAIRV